MHFSCGSGWYMYMRVILIILLASTVCSCTIKVEDQRLTREEVAAAFEQRNLVDEQQIKAIVELQGALEKVITHHPELWSKENAE